MLKVIYFVRDFNQLTYLGTSSREFGQELFRTNRILHFSYLQRSSAISTHLALTDLKSMPVVINWLKTTFEQQSHTCIIALNK